MITDRRIASRARTLAQAYRELSRQPQTLGNVQNSAYWPTMQHLCDSMRALGEIAPLAWREIILCEMGALEGRSAEALYALGEVWDSRADEFDPERRC